MRHLLTTAMTTVVTALALAALTGCGQMGPLYMPPPEDTAKTVPADEAKSGVETLPQQQQADAP